jgi:hypothetical protein
MSNSNLFFQVAQGQSPIESLIGTFINRYHYTDINPIGQVVGVKGKKTLIIRQVIADKMNAKLEWVVGGFSGICLNQHQQEWEFEITANIFEIKISKQNARSIESSDQPIKYYDYNF